MLPADPDVRIEIDARAQQIGLGFKTRIGGEKNRRAADPKPQHQAAIVGGGGWHLLPGRIEDGELGVGIDGNAIAPGQLEVGNAGPGEQVLAFTGDPEGRLDTQLELLETAAPADVDDDLATIRAVIEGLGGDAGVIDATGALLSDEYVAANEVVVDWLTTTCGG